MAFSDFCDSSDPCLVKANALRNTNPFSGVSVPTSGWHLEILELPLNTTLEEIQNQFTKYGTIDRVALLYKLNNKSLNCYLSFEFENNSDEALKENGKKVGPNCISVLKYTEPDLNKGNKRMRTEDSSGGWGSGPSAGGWGSTDTQSSDSWGGGSSDSRGRGGGRGGGGRGGGGGRSCFNCGDEGHMSRECTKPRTGGGGRGGASSGGPRTCFKCGEEGHMSRECPKGGGNRCFNCQEEGHMSRECSKPRAERGRGRGRGNGNRGGDSFGGSSGMSSEWGNSDAKSESKPSADVDWN